VHNYSVSFKMNKDISSMSLFEAVEPQSHLIQGARFVDAQKTGCFDRLVHLLTMGQEFIEKIESIQSQPEFS
jgi:hypothetical protein